MHQVQMLSLTAAKKLSKSGFLAAEILLICFGLSLLAAFTVISGDACQHYYYKQQVRIAADVMASDIRLLQQDSMFSDGILNRQIKFMSDNGGYGFYVDRKVSKRIYFKNLGCDGVYIMQKMPVVQYTNNGSPSFTGNIVLGHKKVSNFRCILSVQPVTGRVVIDES